MEHNSFEIDMFALYLNFNSKFSKEYNYTKSSISISQMKSFIEENSPSFKILAEEHVKQIKKLQQKN